jgi:hypothetical protein
MSLPLFLIAIVIVAWAAILALALGMLHVATKTPTPQRPLPPRLAPCQAAGEGAPGRTPADCPPAGMAVEAA